MTVGFEEGHDDISLQSSEDNDFRIPRTMSNTFLRAIISNDNDISQDEGQTFIRRDQTNSTYYKDQKGRICVLCKCRIAPYCEPNICKKHHIRFNECIKIKSR
jgi:hypothetical protein